MNYLFAWGTVPDVALRVKAPGKEALHVRCTNKKNDEELMNTSPMLKFVHTLLLCVVAAVYATGCNLTAEPMQAEVTVTVFDPDKTLRYEEEDATRVALESIVLTAEGEDQYISGAVGSHTRDFTAGASLTYTLDTTQLEGLSEGYYSLYVRYAIPASGHGEKGTVVTVNGVPYAFMVSATGTWGNYHVAVVSLMAGVNTIEIGGGWNYYRVDSIALIPAAPPAKLLAVAPAPEAQALMEFLTANYGSYTLSGQTEFINYGNGPLELTEFNKVITATGGDAPAIVAVESMLALLLPSPSIPMP